MIAAWAAAAACGQACRRDGRFENRDSGPIHHEVFVWQRQWSPEIEAALGEAREAGISGVAVLSAEITLAGDGAIERMTPAIDWEILRRTGLPVELVVRIGGAGAAAVLDPRSEPAVAVEEVIAERLGTAGAEGVPVGGVQLDLDCPVSKLAAYARWVARVRRRFPDMVMPVTALPSWMDAPDRFRDVVVAAGGYVLQVHALELPSGPGDPVVVCDAAAAERAVDRAAAFGIPFRVAVPTYSSAVVFDAGGRVVDVVSEERHSVGAGGPGRTMSLGRADEASLAGLVARWRTSRPAAVKGLIWFRLPLPGDRMNWRMATWRAVVEGRVPRSDLEVVLEAADDGRLAEIVVHNAGERDEEVPEEVWVAWAGPPGNLVACDGANGFQPDPMPRREPSRGTSCVRFARPVSGNVPFGGRLIRPGDRLVAGWLRLNDAVSLWVHDHRDGESNAH